MDPVTQDPTSGETITKRMSDTSKKILYRLIFYYRRIGGHNCHYSFHGSSQIFFEKIHILKPYK